MRDQLHAPITTSSQSSDKHVIASTPIDGNLVKPLPGSEHTLREMMIRVNYSDIWMSGMEVNMVLRHLANVNTYLEWGSGGSTSNFAQFAKVKAFSIEHNQPWCLKMASLIRSHALLSHVDYRCKSIPAGYMGWGKSDPFEEGNYKIFRSYVDEIDQLGISKVDFVLVDGRARVDCAIKALSYLDKKSVVVLHDAKRMNKPASDRASYESVTKYYHIVDTVGGRGRQGVTVLQRRAEYDRLQGDHAAVQDILNKKYRL